MEFLPPELKPNSETWSTLATSSSYSSALYSRFVTKVRTRKYFSAEGDVSQMRSRSDDGSRRTAA